MTDDLQIPDHTVLARLGRGGMAEVFLARDETLGRLVAVKVMDSRLNADATFVRRFEREARTAAGLNHPNIVPVHMFGSTDDGRRYLTMAYLEGGNLRDRLKKGPLSPEEALGITRQVSGALALAHGRRIVHRDLKPDNILFQGEAASLADFGIAKLMDATTQLTEAGSPGTVKYMSPEQAKGEAVDQRTDLYGLGVVLYEMLTGDLPIDAPSLPAMVYRIVHEPPGALPARLKGLQPLLDALLAKQQTQRIDTAQDLITVIQAVERNLMRGMALDHVMDNVVIPRSKAPAANADLDATETRGGQTALLPDSQLYDDSQPPRDPTGPTVMMPPRDAPPPPEMTTGSLTLSDAPPDDGAPTGTAARTAGRVASSTSGGAARAAAPQTAAKAPALGDEQLSRTVAMSAQDGFAQTRPAGTDAAQPVTSRMPWLITAAAVLLLVGLGAWILIVRSPDTAPAAPPVAAQTGSLSIGSEPAGAEVRLDGQLVGVTPLELGAVPMGAHRLELRLDGYQPYVLDDLQMRSQSSMTVQLEPLETATAASTTAPPAAPETSTTPGTSTSSGATAAQDQVASARLFVDTEPADARVLLLDRRERFSQGIALPPGTYRVRVQQDGYVSEERELQLAGGEFRERVVLQQQPLAVLDLSVSPSSAEVSIDGAGEKRRYSPGMQVPAGTITVTASADGYEDYQQRFTVDSRGLKQNVQLRAKQAPAGRGYRDRLSSGGEGPLMVRVPAGDFRMGDVNDRGSPSEKPVRNVRVGAIAVAKYEVTVDEFSRFVSASSHVTEAESNTERTNGCFTESAANGQFDWVDGRSWKEPGMAQNGQHPVTCVSWNDARAYVGWLAQQSGKRYRLLSEAEWEYAARGGTQTEYAFGSNESDACRNGNVSDATAKARYAGRAAVGCSDGYVHTAPVGSFAANGYGLNDMHGNVWEWVQDCYRESYRGLRGDASAFGNGNCGQYVMRGGAWVGDPLEFRAAYRGYNRGYYRSSRVGLRVAVDL